MRLSTVDRSHIAPAVAEQAVEWLVELQSGDISEQRHQAWQEWRSADSEHERAWQRIEAINQGLRGLDTPLAVAALGAPAQRNRREALKLLMLCALVGGGAFSLRDSEPMMALRSDESTGVGERRALHLADGSHLELNTASAVDIRFDAGQRLIEMRQGEILLDGVSDPRPLRIHTPQGLIESRGGRLNVRVLERSSRVSLFDGSADLLADGQRQSLMPGQQANLSPTRIDPPASASEDSLAWTQGMLVASHMRLDDFLAELGRYRRGHLSCDPQVAGLLISGSYPLDNTERILALLPKALPVEVHSLTRYWIKVHPRATG
ncbi:FecR family protein [Pseudomonas sp. JM0905a]|uniref:FecR family protein n=1 Tax=Metapseudomonas resinovorans TaxID=53412 RepID=A0ABT4Y0Z2_METRE|nr:MULTISPECIES: FecR family protein [Pseudomonas]MBD2838008.1 FecR family protein [Pseudomonas sp. JM0905a]MDA8482498.1 FecR family protein [Pseudomonas resinovorans]